MIIGPGKYDDLCTMVRNFVDADGAVVIIVGGTRGSGFSCQVDLGTLATMPGILETVAAELRKEVPG